MNSLYDCLPSYPSPPPTLVGRVHDPTVGGPCVVFVDGDELVDITHLAPTVAGLFNRDDVHEILDNAHDGRRRWALSDVTTAHARQPVEGQPVLLPPIDLHVIKAAGVTYAPSLYERVVEEQARGDVTRAESVRRRLEASIGTKLSTIRPGSPEADHLKDELEEQGLWSQYLEVGLGPDPEIFTKAPVMSSVGHGAQIGVLRQSAWNNPEPELVLVVRADGKPVGVTLGNDVNLRDVEGRSALLLGMAKDNNGSCAIGPFVRVFDTTFGADDARSVTIQLRIQGQDGFELDDVSSVSKLSRDPFDLIDHAFGAHHQYPDGFVLFTGTVFAPTQDRDVPGHGFTHRNGDVVRISTPMLGTLENVVGEAQSIPPWEFGIGSLIENLRTRELLAPDDHVTHGRTD